MTAKDTIKTIQELCQTPADGIWGNNSAKALAKLISTDPDSEWPPKQSTPQNSAPSTSTAIAGKASSFADPADVAAFKKCKAQGNTDDVCFKVGDNGVGYTGLDTTNLNIPYVAVQPDYMMSRWGSLSAASGKKVLVTISGKTEVCVVGDRMPWIKNTKNGAVIDLAPGAQKLFGLKPPFMVNASWSWT